MEYSNQPTDEIEISIRDVLLTFWDIRRIFLLLIILGGLAGMIFTHGRPALYEARASMIVTAQTAKGTYQNGGEVPGADDIYLSQNLTRTVQLLATSNRVLGQVLEEDSDGNISYEELKNQIVVSTEEGTSFLSIALSWDNEEDAVSMLNSLMEVLPRVMMEVLDIGSVNVIDLADHAELTEQRLPWGIVLGIAGGLILGCVIGVCYYLFVPKIRSKDSLKSLGLDVISEIPFIGKEVPCGSSYLDEDNLPLEYQESYGRLTAVFRYLTEKTGQKIIAVTSSVSGEGKSTVAYNLALRLTERGNRVLLLDFDFKNGVLYKLIRAKKPKDGEVRTETRNTDELEKHVEKTYQGVYTIQGFSRQDLLQEDNKIFPAILRLKEQYDYILIDTPPVGILSDVQQMRELMEGVLFVVRAAVVSAGEVEKSVNFLKQSGMEVIGSVLNGGK